MGKSTVFLIIGILLVGYTVVGVGTNVEEIQETAPVAIEDREWELMRYEGFEYGAWNKHGGYCWYHVRDKRVANTYYRVQIAMWGDELQFYYGGPETINRIDTGNINISTQ